jgi:hypothetical protein
LELALQSPFHVGLIRGRNQAAVDEQLGQRNLLARDPVGADVNKLRGVDQIRLEREDAEKQVAIRIHGGFSGTGIESALISCRNSLIVLDLLRKNSRPLVTSAAFAPKGR